MIFLNVYFDKFAKDAVQDFAESTAHRLKKQLNIKLVPKKHNWLKSSKEHNSRFRSFWGAYSYTVLLHLEYIILRFNRVKNNYDWGILEQIDFALIGELLGVSEINIYLGVEAQQRDITKRGTITLAIESYSGSYVSNLGWAGLEVIYESPSTIVSVSMKDSNLGLLQKLSGRYPTMHSVVKNIKFMNAVALQMSLELLKNCTETSHIRLLQKEATNIFLSKNNPQLSASKILGYSSRQFAHATSNMITCAKKAKVSPEWHIAYAMCPLSELDNSEIHIVTNPAGRSLADPFVVTWAEQTVIFVEDIDLQSGKGSISVIDFDSKRDTIVTTCIQEEFHLSFPFTFEYEGELYMCPESSRSDGIRIYRCRTFPHGWDFVREIISGIKAVDTIIIPSDDIWWMLTGVSNLGNLGRMSELHCFYSANPLSAEWLSHIPEVVVRDSLSGRNGGYFVSPTSMIRVAQKFGFQSYGIGLSVLEVTNISKYEYSEKKLFDLEVNKDSHLTGLHHLSSSEKISAFDFLAPRDIHKLTTFEKLGISIIFPDVAH